MCHGLGKRDLALRHGFSRRELLKSSGAIAAGTALAGLVLPKVHAAENAESETIQAGETIVFSGTIRNTGELSTGALRVRTEVWGTQFENGKEKEVKISEETSEAENIDAGQSSSARIETRILTPGEYRVRVIVEGENAGSDEEVFVLSAEGEMVSLCDADTSRAFEKNVDGFLNMCREKRFCTGCGFSFECRNVWETAQPASGEGYYDTTRGESGFTYYLTPLSISGTC